MIKYAIITPARNEENNIVRLFKSLSNQTQLPEKWVIVDDGSTDKTPGITDKLASENDWVEVVHRPEHIDRNFAGKVHAFNAGMERLESVDYDIVGNMDSDTSIEPEYMEFLMEKFAANADLGVAGTPFAQDDGYDSARDSFEGENYVSGGCQLFRKKCFEDIGGYVPNAAGGIDWIAVMTARMKGWRVTCFSEMRYHHYRPLGTAERGRHGALVDYGERAYYLGSSPIWHLFRVIYRLKSKPFITGSIALSFGYLSAWIRQIKRPVSKEMIHFYRKDQMHKLGIIFSSLFRFQKIDSFGLEKSAPHKNG